METWAGRRIRVAFLTVVVVKVLYQFFDYLVALFYHPLRTEFLVPAAIWWIVWNALFLLVPALVVHGPLRRVPWLIWLVLVEAILQLWVLVEWVPMHVQTPRFLFDAATSAVLVVLAFSWVRVSNWERSLWRSE